MSRILRSVVLFLVTMMALGGISGQVFAQDAGSGSVRVVNYYCTYLDQTLLVEAIDTSECALGAGRFTFYLVGDGTADFQQLAVDGSGDGSISLPAGTYEMVVEETQTHMTVTVGAGQTTQLLIGNPSGDVLPAPPQPVETGTVTLQRYACSYLDTTLLAEAIEQEKCSPVAATFSFYLYGDGTDDYYAAYTDNDGQGSVVLPVGTYDMVDELSQTHFDVNVLTGENIVLLVAGPRTAPPAPAPTEVPSKPSDGNAPTKLPSTGAGIRDQRNVGVVEVAGIATVVLAGAAIVRRGRENAA